MKKILFYIAILGSVYCIYSCDGNKNIVENISEKFSGNTKPKKVKFKPKDSEKGFLSSLFSIGEKDMDYSGDEYYETYQEACLNNDYVAAHEYLGLLKSDIKGKDSEKEYYDAAQYIYTQEMLYLIGEGTDAAIKRVKFLLTEFNQQVLEQDLRNKTYSMLVDLALSLNNTSLAEEILLGYQIVGEPISEGLQPYYYIASNISPFSSAKEADEERLLYVWSLGDYNKICNRILDYAIAKGDSRLAKKALTLFKPNVHVTMGRSKGVRVKGVVVDDNHSYVEYRWEDKNLAQKRYNEAVANGLIKKI